MRRFRVAPVVLLLAACAPEADYDIAFDDVLCTEDARNGVAVRDSAGIEIVENGAPERGAHVSIAAEPTLEIGITEGDEAYMFGQIVAATRLPDGHIVVADGQSLDLRVFDAEGGFLHRFGGRGNGPGEHQVISRLLRQGDTLLVIDRRQSRITRVLPDGTVPGVTTIEPIPFSYVSNGRTISGRYIPDVRGRFADGTFLATRTIRRGPSEIETRIARTPFLLTRIQPATGSGDSIGVYRATEDFMYLHPDGAFTFGNAPFGKPGLIGPATDRFYIAEGDAFEIRETMPDGALTRVIRICERPDPVTEEAYEAYVQRFIEPLTGIGRQLEETAHRGIPRPEFAAPYLDMQIDDVGNRLWIRDFTFHGAPHVWRVLDTDGRWLGEGTVPEDLEVLEIGDDYLLALARDEFDVESVQLYALEVER